MSALPPKADIAPAIRSPHRHGFGDRAEEKSYFDQFKIALDPEDIARAILFALSQPRHVQVAEMVVLPVNRW